LSVMRRMAGLSTCTFVTSTRRGGRRLRGGGALASGVVDIKASLQLCFVVENNYHLHDKTRLC
jgi:hypothetical protein